MRKRRIVRLILALFFLCIACLLLVWAFWPFGDVSRILPIPPEDLQLPTPEGMLWGMGLVI